MAFFAEGVTGGGVLEFGDGAEVAGVEFVDDSLSTNVLPTLAALEALGDRPVALLVGGQDRGIDYGPLAAALGCRKGETLVATLPAAGLRIGAAVRAAGVDVAGVDVADFEDLADAVATAFDWARARRSRDGRAGVVLLSPAAPSFGQFRDYRQRSEAFCAAMRRCATTELLRQARPARGGS